AACGVVYGDRGGLGRNIEVVQRLRGAGRGERGDRVIVEEIARTGERSGHGGMRTGSTSDGRWDRSVLTDSRYRALGGVLAEEGPAVEKRDAPRGEKVRQSPEVVLV